MVKTDFTSVKYTGVCIPSIKSNPTKGPKILFFSGGTALGAVAACLTKYTENSLHIITPFDSGGSSAALRNAFSMPAVGDLRARLIALASRAQEDQEARVQLFKYRLPYKRSQRELLDEYMQLVNGTHGIVRGLSRSSLQWIHDELLFFMKKVPTNFNFDGASIGNILLTSKYLQAGRSLENAVDFYSEWLGVRGIVKPLVDVNMHLCVELDNGKHIVGQHLFTGKGTSGVSSRIRDIWITESLESMIPTLVKADVATCEAIRSADLLCFSMGSFFSSLIANLLPEGIVEAIRQSTCEKVFIPNVNHDPELFGYSLQDQVSYLGAVIGKGTGKFYYPTILVLDGDPSVYPGGVLYPWLMQRNIRITISHLVTGASAPYLDPEAVCSALLKLIKK